MIYRSAAGERLIQEQYRRTLARWPVEHEQLRLPTPEGETFVIASGPAEAPPLVLLHGSGSDSTQWSDRIPEFAARFRSYAVDILGEPGGSAPNRPPSDSDRYAVWLDAVLDELGVRDARFMGISLGGWMALDYATRRPDRVTRLALCCPIGIGGQRTAHLAKALLLNLFGERGKRASMRGLLGPALDELDPAEREALFERVRLVTENYRYRVPPPVFGDDTLRGLRMPVGVIAGTEDAMVDSAATKRRLEALVPHARVRLLPSVGHFVPAQLAEELAFLGG
ncbi:alpha/beta fold hydrolase [Sciscionella sediminilitoris]|uniref:alpha/beta fold hydrolase n=1 Tax=Sciscionella sediminilitoris TaxID=1445613 RepID=UPI0004DEE16C|nr:alpha/beta fold hydrolase [Sciscionella sp. SE31]